MAQFNLEQASLFFAGANYFATLEGFRQMLVDKEGEEIFPMASQEGLLSPWRAPQGC